MHHRSMIWPKVSLTDGQWDLIFRFAPQGLSVIDLETTGLSPAYSEILEIAALKLNPDHTLAYFHEMVRPQNKIDPASTAIHGIRDDDVATADGIALVLPRFVQFLGPSALIAHNALFDGGHLVWQAAQHQITLPALEVYCSCRLARYAFPELSHHALAFLAQHLALQDWHHHQALDDTVIALQVILAALARLTQTDFVPRRAARPTMLAKAQSSLPLPPATAPEDFLTIARQKSFLYQLNVFAPVQHEPLPPHLLALPDLCHQQALLKIKYTQGHHPHQWRPLKVTSILPTPQGTALYGFCLQSKMFKTFRIKYIEAWAKPLPEEMQSWAQELPPIFASSEAGHLAGPGDKA